MVLSLGKGNWKLMGHWPFTPYRGQSMETGVTLQGVTDWIDAKVPGCVQDDLLRAGLIPDPYFEKNSVFAEWVENRWWQYRLMFTTPIDAPKARQTLRFLGIDYVAHIYLNGEYLGKHEGMYDPICIDVTGKLLENGENRLDVLIEDAPKEFGQIGYTSLTDTQKSRFGYKWDFGTRLVHLGIWKDVELYMTGTVRIEKPFIAGGISEDGSGFIRIQGKIDSMRKGILCEANIDGNVYRIDPHPHTGAFDETICIEDPRLWNVNGLGEQNLYKVVLTVSDEDGVSDIFACKTGIRSLTYRRTDDADLSAMPYIPVINGKEVYIKGVNMTPLDHMYGKLRRADYDRILTLAQKAGINLIRVWGGGVIETEDFYDLCDEKGIMVWQEFIQSSSGLDNIPSKLPHFLQLISVASTAALLEKRNHVSHTFWSGGNELMGATDHPVSYGDENIAVLKKLCDKYDPDKLFLPTSASGPTEWLLLDRPGTNHDIHGAWQFEGVTEHYRIFNLSDSMLHSEFGTDGLSSPQSIARVISPERFHPVSMKKDLVWRHHGEWWDEFDRDTALFGTLPNVEKWSLVSQFLQAESIRYGLEANRRRAYRNAGSIIWQFNEPWPNVSCTCLVEFSGAPKIAYTAVKQAYSVRHLSLKYDSLICKAGAEFNAELYAHNSLEECDIHADVRVMDTMGKVYGKYAFDFTAAQNGTTFAGNINCTLPEVPGAIFMADIALTIGGKAIESYRVLFSQKEDTPFSYMLSAEETAIAAKRVENGVILENTGDVPAFCVRIVSKVPGAVLPSEDGIVLLPGEKRTIALDGDGECDVFSTNALTVAF